MRGAVRAAGRLVTRPEGSWHLMRWTVRNARRLAESLSGDGLAALDAISPPPHSSEADRVIVSGTLRGMRATCLVRTAILQRWDAEHGRPGSLHIGVRRVAGRVEAHAWLDGERVSEDFSELHLHPPPVAPPAPARADG